MPAAALTPSCSARTPSPPKPASRPLIIVAGYSAYPRRINFARMREIADAVDATLLVDMAHFAGLVAGKVFTGDYDPIPHAQIVTSTTHKSLRGPRGGLVLCDTELADYVDRGCPLVLGGPMGHIMAAKAVALAEARRPGFAVYAQRIVDNAQALADVTSSFGVTGRQAESALLDAGVVTNRSSIPNDVNGAWYTSGIRLGTPALTTLGMGPDEMDEVADIIATVLTATQPASDSQARYDLDPAVAEAGRKRAADLLDRFPLYPGLQL